MAADRYPRRSGWTMDKRLILKIALVALALLLGLTEVAYA